MSGGWWTRFFPFVGIGFLQTHNTHAFLPSTVQWKLLSRCDNWRKATCRPPLATLDPFSSSSSITDLTLAELLQELDRLQLRYYPSNSRQELEEILSQHHRQQQQQQPTRRRNNRANQSLATLLDELDKRNIRYAPSANRNDLEELLRQAMMNQGTTTTTTEDKKPKTASKPIGGEAAREKVRALIQELDRQNIRYPPTARRSDLEALLRRHQQQQQQQQETTTPPPQKTARTKPSIREILQQLDQRNIRYAPSASRQELENLLQQQIQTEEQEEEEAQEEQSSNINASEPSTAEATIRTEEQGENVPNSSTMRSRTEAERRLYRRRRRRQQNRKPVSRVERVLKRSAEWTSRGVQGLPQQVARIRSDRSALPKRVLDQVKRQTRKAQRNLADFIATDEDGIREPTWYYVNESNGIIDVGGPADAAAQSSRDDKESDTNPKADGEQIVTEIVNDGTSAKRKRRRRPRATTIDASFRTDDEDRVWQSQPPGPSSLRRRKPKKIVNARYQLPPGSQDTIPFPEDMATNKSRQRESTDTRPPPEQRETSSQKEETKRRKVYNPLNNDVGEDKEVDPESRDAFDRLGDRVADAVEQVLWGPEPVGREESPPKRTRERKKTASKARIWKDRMEEQIDYILGVHDDGAYYNSWEKQLGADLPRRPPRREKHRVKQFWEQDGNLMSLLLGRNPGGSLKWDVSNVFAWFFLVLPEKDLTQNCCLATRRVSLVMKWEPTL